VLTQAFVDSTWGMYEFGVSQMQIGDDPSFKIILVALQDVKKLENVPRGLKAYLRTWTYLKRTDHRFWKKLRYEMPHRRRPRDVRHRQGLLDLQEIM